MTQVQQIVRDAAQRGLNLQLTLRALLAAFVLGTLAFLPPADAAELSWWVAGGYLVAVAGLTLWLRRGDRTALTHRGATIATVLRSRERARPLFVSTGHRISAELALELVLATLTRYRLPEPTRLADRVSRMHP